MLVKVLKGFAYAHDGIHGRDLVADAVEEVRDDLVPGLVVEGYVAAPDGVIEVSGPVTAAQVVEMENAHAAQSADPSAADAPAGAAEDQPKAAEPDGERAPVAPKAKRAAKPKA